MVEVAGLRNSFCASVYTKPLIPARKSTICVVNWRSRMQFEDKRIEGMNPLYPFMVEVAGLELAASSTRNWRATTCATPRLLTY